jgi:hypothetical protein
VEYGNCLICCFFLLWKERKNKPRFIIRKRPKTWVPHFMIRSSTGLHHYRVVKEIVPFPFGYFLFKGEFQTLPLESENIFFWNVSKMI